MPIRFLLAIAFSCLVAASHGHAENRTPSANAATDPDIDLDDDGLTNRQEALKHTKPKVPDTDGDGVFDAQDATGYEPFFKFTAAPESSYALVDLGPLSAGAVRVVNNLGTVVVGLPGGTDFQVLKPGVEALTITGTFGDLNNLDTVLYKTPDSEAVLKTRRADGTVDTYDYSALMVSLFGESDMEGEGFSYLVYTVNSRVIAAGVLDTGEVIASGSAEFDISFVDFDEDWEVYSSQPLADAVVTTGFKDFEPINGTGYIDAYHLGTEWGEARTMTIKDFLVYNDYELWEWEHQRRRRYLGHSLAAWVDVADSESTLAPDPLPTVWSFCDATTYTEPSETAEADRYRFMAAGQLPGQPGLWKSWASGGLAHSLSLSDPASGKAIEDGRKGAPLRIEAIGENGLMLGNSYSVNRGGVSTLRSDLWRNGRIVQPAELIAAESAWSDLSISHMSDNGRFLTASAKNANGVWHSALLVPAALQVDTNRDGKIDPQDQAPTGDKPFRFWSNDDDDGIFSNSQETEEDDLEVTTTQREDWRNNVIDVARDLEDFARLHLHVGGLHDAFKNGQLYLGFKWTDTGGTNPSIKLYRATDADGGTGYLNEPNAANRQALEVAIVDDRHPAYSGPPWASNYTVIGTGDFFVLPTLQSVNLSATNPTLRFIFEGCTTGKGQLKLVFLKQENGAYTEIGEGPGVWLDIKNPHEFIQRWTCGDGSLAAVQPVQFVAGKSGSFAAPVKGEEKDLVLYIHGYNMLADWEKQRWIETTFKRLYWLGFKGRVGGFTWPCVLSNGIKFDSSEKIAWESGAELRNLLTTLKGQGYRVHVLAHSMGNIVVGEALRLSGVNSELVTTYIASQAAIAAHTYDASLPSRTDFTPSTPNVYARYWVSGQSPRYPESWNSQIPAIWRRPTCRVPLSSSLITTILRIGR